MGLITADVVLPEFELYIIDLDAEASNSSMAQMVARGAHNPEVTRSRRVAAILFLWFFFFLITALFSGYGFGLDIHQRITNAHDDGYSRSRNLYQRSAQEQTISKEVEITWRVFLCPKRRWNR